MAELAYLVRQRAYKRAQITKLYNKVQSEVSQMDSDEKFELGSKLEQLGVDIRVLDGKIDGLQTDLVITDANFKSMMDDMEKYSNIIIQAITLLKSSSYEDDDDSDSHSGRASLNHTKFRLPEIPLPFYSHAKGESLDHFLSSFSEIVDKYPVNSYVKFCLLKEQLKGEAYKLVNSLPVAQQTFTQAKELLEEAFASSATKEFDVLYRLLNLKLEYGGNAYEYVGEMRSIEAIIRGLEMSIDTVLRFFFWNSMHSGLQNQLVNICNDHRPSLKDINDNVFRAIDRFREVYERNKMKQTRQKQIHETREYVSSYAADVSYTANKRLPFCSLCTVGNQRESNHSTKDCPVYETPESKVSRLNAVGACTNCGFGNHSTDRCKFKFRRKCFNCDSEHMTFLCTNSMSSLSKDVPFDKRAKNNRDRKMLNTNVVYTSALKAHVGSNVLVPTFVCSVNNSNNRKIRCMKDTGCQPNFIKSSVADELKLKVVENKFEVVVNGFVDSEIRNTKIVEVEMIIGNDVKIVEAICTPKIRTHLVLPGLSELARLFVAGGSTLADPYLTDGTDTISDLDFVLGTCNPEVLVENQIVVIWMQLAT